MNIHLHDLLDVLDLVDEFNVCHPFVALEPVNPNAWSSSTTLRRTRAANGWPWPTYAGHWLPFAGDGEPWPTNAGHILIMND